MAVNHGMASALAKIHSAARDGRKAAAEAGEWTWVAKLADIEDTCSDGLSLAAHELAELEVQKAAQLKLVGADDRPRSSMFDTAS